MTLLYCYGDKIEIGVLQCICAWHFAGDAILRGASVPTGTRPEWQPRRHRWLLRRLYAASTASVSTTSVKTVRRSLSRCRRERLIYSHIHLVKSLQPHPTVSIKPLDRPLDHWTDHWTIGPTIGPLDQPLDHWTNHWTIGPTIGPSDRPLDHLIDHCTIGSTIGTLDRQLDHQTEHSTIGPTRTFGPLLDDWTSHWTIGSTIGQLDKTLNQ